MSSFRLNTTWYPLSNPPAKRNRVATRKKAATANRVRKPSYDESQSRKRRKIPNLISPPRVGLTRGAENNGTATTGKLKSKNSKKSRETAGSFRGSSNQQAATPDDCPSNTAARAYGETDDNPSNADRTAKGNQEESTSPDEDTSSADDDTFIPEENESFPYQYTFTFPPGPLGVYLQLSNGRCVVDSCAPFQKRLQPGDILLSLNGDALPITDDFDEILDILKAATNINKTVVVAPCTENTDQSSEENANEVSAPNSENSDNSTTNPKNNDVNGRGDAISVRSTKNLVRLGSGTVPKGFANDDYVKYVRDNYLQDYIKLREKQNTAGGGDGGRLPDGSTSVFIKKAILDLKKNFNFCEKRTRNKKTGEIHYKKTELKPSSLQNMLNRLAKETPSPRHHNQSSLQNNRVHHGQGIPQGDRDSNNQANAGHGCYGNVSQSRGPVNGGGNWNLDIDSGCGFDVGRYGQRGATFNGQGISNQGTSLGWGIGNGPYGQDGTFNRQNSWNQGNGFGYAQGFGTLNGQGTWNQGNSFGFGLNNGQYGQGYSSTNGGDGNVGGRKHVRESDRETANGETGASDCKTPDEETDESDCKTSNGETDESDCKTANEKTDETGCENSNGEIDESDCKTSNGETDASDCENSNGQTDESDYEASTDEADSNKTATVAANGNRGRGKKALLANVKSRKSKAKLPSVPPRTRGSYSVTNNNTTCTEHRVPFSDFICVPAHEVKHYVVANEFLYGRSCIDCNLEFDGAHKRDVYYCKAGFDAWQKIPQDERQDAWCCSCICALCFANKQSRSRRRRQVPAATKK